MQSGGALGLATVAPIQDFGPAKPPPRSLIVYDRKLLRTTMHPAGPKPPLLRNSQYGTVYVESGLQGEFLQGREFDRV